MAILGGSGQLGNYLSSYFSKYFNVTSFSSKSFPFPNVNIYEKLAKFDIIINCAGYPYRFKTINYEKSEKLSEKMNYNFVIFISNYCKNMNKKLIHISTNAVYSSNNIYLHKESEYNKHPIVPYDKHKLLADLYIENNLSDYLIIRLYNLHGNPASQKKFFNTLTNIIDCSRNKIIIINGITAQFVSGKLIAKAIIHLLNIDERGIFNLGTQWVYRAKLVKSFLKIIDEKNIDVKNVPREFFNIKNVTHGLMNCRKIQASGFDIPMPYDDIKDWWYNQLSTLNKKNIIQSLNNIKNNIVISKEL